MFDKVPHNKLMFKVKQLGIVGKVHNSIEKWLNNSTIHNIYINDIDLGLHNFIAKFADDTKIGNSVISDRGRQLKPPRFAQNLRMV